MKSLRGRFLGKYKSLPAAMASLKQTFLPPLNLPTLHESFDNNILSVPEITKDVFQEETLLSPEEKHQSTAATVPLSDQLLEEFQELTCRKTEPLCEETQKEDQDFPALLEFEEKCPPGGRESVVLYTTSLRGINKTFEDCKRIRFLLDSFKVVYHERDVSMHLEYREELWNILGGGGRVIPPRLFIKGRLIGGADEVVGLHERGALKKLLNGIPLVPSVSPCKGCSGMRFVLCLKCHGSCKITAEDKMNDVPVRCPDCNENGLIKCPLCN